MKKYIALIAIAAISLCMILAGCGSGGDFKDTEWQRETDVCTETIYFGSDGDFSYYCSCGEPVDDSDLCETYSYDEKSGIITLNYEGSPREIKLVSVDNNKLALDFDGEERCFKR